jgi:hypothetical protein
MRLPRGDQPSSRGSSTAMLVGVGPIGCRVAVVTTGVKTLPVNATCPFVTYPQYLSCVRNIGVTETVPPKRPSTFARLDAFGNESKEKHCS